MPFCVNDCLNLRSFVDESEEEEAPPPKKAAAAKPAGKVLAAKAPAAKEESDDDDDDDDDGMSFFSFFLKIFIFTRLKCDIYRLLYIQKKRKWTRLLRPKPLPKRQEW